MTYKLGSANITVDRDITEPHKKIYELLLYFVLEKEKSSHYTNCSTRVSERRI